MKVVEKKTKGYNGHGCPSFFEKSWRLYAMETARQTR
jgi:hypothetical protein